MEALESAAPPDETPCTSAGQLLAGLGKVATRRFGAALVPVGIRPRHLNALLTLRAGPTTQQGLAEAIRVDAVQLVGLLNDLEDEELIVRRRDPADRRRHIVEISCKAAARLAALDTAVAEVEDGLLTCLDPAERKQLRALLLRVAAATAEDGPVDEAPTESASPGAA